MKKKHSMGSGVSMPVCRKADDAGNQTGETPCDRTDAREKGRDPVCEAGIIWKLKRVMPSMTVVLLISTLVFHMTIGGGAALVPILEDEAGENRLAAADLAPAESISVTDSTFSRGNRSDTLTEATESEPAVTTAGSTENPDAIDNLVDETTQTELVTEPEITEPPIVFDNVDETMFLQAERVNMRVEPTTDADIITVLSYGQSMRRTGVSTEWSRVELENGSSGYIVSRYIDNTPPPTPTPTPTPVPVPTKAPAPTASPEPAAVPKASSMSAETQQQMITLARSFIGSKYVYGTSGPTTFDCSGFTSYIYREMFGVSLPRSARDQAFAGTKVSASDIQVGDIICFDWKRNGSCDHVALYVGNGQYVDASYSRGLVREATVNFSTNPIISIRRIVN